MLVLTRKTGQSITIQPDTKLDAATPVGTLFNDGPIEVQIKQVGRGSVTLGINANKQFCILRNELQLQTPVEPQAAAESLNIQQALAKNLQSISQQLNLGPAALAEKTGIPLMKINDIFQGRADITLTELELLAQVLGTGGHRLIRP